MTPIKSMNEKLRLNEEEQRALHIAKVTQIEKRSNAIKWSHGMENLLKTWGEKAFGLRWMHVRNAEHWKHTDNCLSVASIVLGSFASITSMSSADSQDSVNKPYIMYGIGILGLISVMCQSIKRFYAGEEKAAEHSATAKRFGAFYRTIALQLGMTRSERNPPDILGDWALREYDGIQKDAPDITEAVMKEFNEVFRDAAMAIPDIMNDRFTIEVFVDEHDKCDTTTVNEQHPSAINENSAGIDEKSQPHASFQIHEH